MTHETIAAALAHFAKYDPKLHAVVSQIGPPTALLSGIGSFLFVLFCFSDVFLLFFFFFDLF